MKQITQWVYNQQDVTYTVKTHQHRGRFQTHRRENPRRFNCTQL